MGTIKNKIKMTRVLLALAMWLPLQASAENIFKINQHLAPGLNYGNVLEANPPQAWGQKLVLEDFKNISKVGFKSLRLPVRWSAMASQTAPYTIKASFFQTVDSAVQAAMKAHLYVVLNMHHYDALFTDPQGNEKRFLAMWTQIAEHYQGYSSALLFEILNEPHNKLNNALWVPMYKKALGIIRKSNPTRVVVISGAGWGGAKALNDLVLPKDKSNLIFTFHYYSPFHFTHQGADWVGEKSKKWLGTVWKATGKNIRETNKEFKEAQKFSRRHHVPIYVGEFGAYSKADMQSRIEWTANVVETAKKFGFSTAYWEYKAGFGLWDAEKGKWNTALRDAAQGK